LLITTIDKGFNGNKTGELLKNEELSAQVEPAERFSKTLLEESMLLYQLND